MVATHVQSKTVVAICAYLLKSIRFVVCIRDIAPSTIFSFLDQFEYANF